MRQASHQVVTRAIYSVTHVLRELGKCLYPPRLMRLFDAFLNQGFCVNVITLSHPDEPVADGIVGRRLPVCHSRVGTSADAVVASLNELVDAVRTLVREKSRYPTPH